MRLKAILLCGTMLSLLGIVLVSITASQITSEPGRVLARLRWEGTRGDSGHALFLGVREGRSVTGSLYVAGREVPVTATVDASGVWAGKVSRKEGGWVGEFAGQIADGKLRGMYSFADGVEVLPSAVSTAGQYEVYMAVGFDEPAD